MNQPIPTGPDLFGFAQTSYEKAKYAGHHDDNPIYGSPEELYHFMAATLHAQQANTAALVMIAECVTDGSHFDFDGWREKIGLTWLKKCRGKDVRRPQCTPVHTEGCAYADPIPEPKHVLLPVGTRVLVSERRFHEEDFARQPYVAQVVGYNTGKTKYRVQQEDPWTPGAYYESVRWAFADNRVEIHPDGPECPPLPTPPKREPTGPRIYVQDRRGKQGYVVEVYHHEKDDTLWYTVQFFRPGAQPVKKNADSLTVIAASQVERCPNGQTGDECGSGENQCEPCVQADDEEGDEIERSMGLR